MYAMESRSLLSPFRRSAADPRAKLYAQLSHRATFLRVAFLLVPLACLYPQLTRLLTTSADSPRQFIKFARKFREISFLACSLRILSPGYFGR